MTFSKERFCEYLRTKLLIEDFSDSLGFAHLAMMSLGVGVLYTTNQDNIMEKCFEKYGRDLKVITTLSDLANSMPGDRFFIKFHGDLYVPDSIVFTAGDYENRMGSVDHFLNIRLRSDLLAKRLFFIGYSLRDKNIQEILKEIEVVFRGNMPVSYMLAWEYSDELEEHCKQYGIKLIDPMKEFPESRSNQEAFEKFLNEFVTQTLIKKTDKEIKSIFTPNVPQTQKVVSPLEIQALKQVINEEGFMQGCQKFRAIMDSSLIPIDFEEKVLEMFETLAQKCSSTEESDYLNAAGSHLNFSKVENLFGVLVLLMTTANARKKGSGPFGQLYMHVKGMPKETYIGAVAFAIEKLFSWERPITDTFRSHVSTWMDYSRDFNEFDHKTQSFIKHWIDEAWKGQTIYENPIKRQQRLNQLGHPLMGKSMDSSDILSRMMNSLPKSFGMPYEE